jgi:DNA replication protein DnaC
MSRSLVFDLATAGRVGRREDSLFLDPPGSGKSHCAQAIDMRSSSRATVRSNAKRMRCRKNWPTPHWTAKSIARGALHRLVRIGY